MSVLMPVIVVLLALIAAGSIAWLAWDLTSKDTHEALERALGRNGTLSPPSAGPTGEPETRAGEGNGTKPDDPPPNP